MTRLLVYCVLRDEQFAQNDLPIGIDGHSVRLVARDGLAAALSAVSDATAMPNVPRAKVFASVIQALHELTTVLPMRFGCLLDTEDQAAELLRKHHDEFRASLEELEGCAEMGIRVLLGQTAVTLFPPARASLAPASGMDYLAARKDFYAERDLRHGEGAGLIDEMRRAFDGLFVRWVVEGSLAGAGRLLSLYFLTPRGRCGAFRAAFHQLQQHCPERMILTGPWPPHNFAAFRPASALASNTVPAPYMERSSLSRTEKGRLARATIAELLRQNPLWEPSVRR